MVNARIHSSHGSKPFELMFLRKLDATGFREECQEVDPTNWKNHAETIVNFLFPLVNEKILEYRGKYKSSYDAKKVIATDLDPGALVMVRSHEKRKGKKLDAVFLGPFIVKRRTPFGTYDVTTLEGVDHKTRISRNDLKLINGSLEDFSKEFEVEMIIKHRKVKNNLQFLVKWVGYNKRHNLWLPLQNLVGLELLDAYLKQHNINSE